METNIVECESINSSSEEYISDSKVCKEKIKNTSEGNSKTSLSSVSSENVSTVGYSLPFKSSKRHGIFLNNSKPNKWRRSMEEFSRASQKYSFESFCGVNDHLPNGFYDARRDHPFKPLINFQKENLFLDSQEMRSWMQ